MSKEAPTELRDLAEFVCAHSAPTGVSEKDDGEVHLVFVPGQTHPIDLKPYQDALRAVPRRIKGTSNHQTVASLLTHIAKFKDGDSVLFANGIASDPKVTAVYNYNQDGTKPRFGDHRAVLTCQLSDEWKTWTEQAASSMDQGDFAEFLEANIGDVQDAPDLNDDANSVLREISMTLQYPFASQKQMMSMSKGIEINQSTKAKVQVNLQTGERVLQFESENSGADGARLSIPGLFLIAIPVFKDGHIYRLPVRLRYRANGSGVVWSFDIYRDDKAFKLAYDEVCASIQQTAQLPLYVGSPEQ